ncbi:MAG: isoprenylcysteine carboxylmethyltransferase family protein [Gammaproteobacteria bacterium]|nr:isoprenylcysteine carboxylmethyltransferase family protein [Gammaproteobacteria bacterium]
MMNTINDTHHLVLALLMLMWCTLHSVMISISVTTFLQKHLTTKYRFYRLFYNIVAIGTLIPLAVYAWSLQSQAIFEWTGYWGILQVLFLSLGGLLFYIGARHYDARQFLGFTQIKKGTPTTAITTSGEFDSTGILGVVRHPWYLGLILIIWARPLDLSAIIVNVILTGYLIVGSVLEEKKLVREFGDKYRHYQKTVSMLLPIKWLSEKLNKS